MPEQFDVIVIGSGQGGNPLAKAFARDGRKTALIEKDHVGGTCVNTGCTPTKTMIASARVAHMVRRAADYGVHVSPDRAAPDIVIDMERVRERKREMVDKFRGGSLKSIENTENLSLIRGTARFSSENTVLVELNDGGTREYSAPTIVINTGLRPLTPDIDGIDSVPYFHEAEIMELEDVPQHLIIVGGGYIGLEFGQMFRRFGSEVTIIHEEKRLTSREDPDVAEEILKIFREDGINVLLSSEAQSVEMTADNKIRVKYSAPDGGGTITGTHLLIGAGRVPNTDMLNLEAAGVKTNEKGFITVDDQLRTSADGIYAIGDVKGGPAFTHISYDDYRIVAENLIRGGNASIQGRIVPYTMFIDPQLGRVGLTESHAREQGYRVRVAKMPMAHAARARETGETRGLMKAVVDADTGQILGCAILGVEGGEVMSVLQVAMMGKLPYTAIRDNAFAHPLLSESLNNLFMTLD